MAQHYDACAEDLGNIVMLETINLQIPDSRRGRCSKSPGLGLTRDPPI